MWFLKRVPESLQKELERDAELHNEVVRINENDQAGQQAEAQSGVEALVREWPAHYWAHFIAAAFYRRWGHIAEATREYAIALALQPENPLPYKKLGTLLRQEGQSDVASAILSQGWRLYSTLMKGRTTDEDKAGFWGDT